MKTQVLHLTRDGKTYYCDAKLAWGKKYYSFDGGLSWRRTKDSAYLAAKDNGLLHEVGTVKTVLCD
jgi:hypothetical protein